MLSFHKCQVSVNGSGLLAESAQISTQSTLQEVRTIGRKGVYTQTVNGGQSISFNINYNIDVRQEPIFQIAKSLRENQELLNFDPVQIVIGGITGMGYLESYALKTAPNQLTKATANFLCFSEISGDLSQKSDSYIVSENNFSGLSNSWTLFISNDLNKAYRPILNFDYQLQSSWKPIYKLGSIYPSEVRNLGGEENAKLLHSDFKTSLPSGQNVLDYENVSKFEPTWLELSYIIDKENKRSISFDLSNSIVISSQASVQLNSVATSETSIARYF